MELEDKLKTVKKEKKRNRWWWNIWKYIFVSFHQRLNNPIVGLPWEEETVIVTLINHTYLTDIWLILLCFIENPVLQPS